MSGLLLVLVILGQVIGVTPSPEPIVCPCFVADDIALASTCPGGGGPAIPQCASIGDAYLNRINCVGGTPSTYDFYADPTPTGCSGPDTGSLSITSDEYDACFAILLVECPSFE